MGETRVTIQVATLSGERKEALEAIVDTGATFSVIPTSTLKRLHIKRQEQEKVAVELANGHTITRWSGEARIEINGKSRVCPILFGRPQEPMFLGVTALEALGLTVDPMKGRLKPRPILLY